MNPGQYRLTFSRHANRTIDQIAKTDSGLLFLDRQLAIIPKSWKAYQAIRDYLSDPVISVELDLILETLEQ